MRILLDLQACQATNRHRGIGRYSMSLAQAMARQASGHDVRIVLNSRFAETVEPIRAAFDGLVARENIVVFDAPAAVAEIDAQHAWRCRAAERVREMALAQLRPDVVHVASLFEGLVDDAVSSVGHLNQSFGSAVTLYDLIPLLRKEAYLSDPRVRDWYYRKLQGLKNADLLLAISGHTRREAIASLHLPEARVVNISAAVDAVFQPRALSEEEAAGLRSRYGLRRPFVMYTGGIDVRKNIEGLITAYARLPEAIRSAHQLAIICKIEAPDRQRLQALATSSGLPGDAVVFTGFVPDEDLVALYNTCALFVFPSLHEGFGLPALEAMSCGAPVIGANTSSIPEVIGREDALFDPTDVQAIAAKMLQALTDHGFRTSLKQHAEEQARQFSWDASARSALQAFEHLHKQKQAAQRSVMATGCHRPRLAYVSPLPPGKSGIADYSAELLPELARYYDIDVVVDQEEITDTWVAANFMPRTVQWFREHADGYDRILYHFGNSSFHQHMFDLLEQHPGIVVLHDFFLSGILNYLEGAFRRPGAFRNALYQSHGYPALVDDKVNGREAAFWKYPCNKAVLDQATGVIVHSEFSRQLARLWYGPDSSGDWQTIPLLRAFPALGNRAEVREQARQRLGIGNDEFLICSFGLLGPTKLNDRLLNAWLESPLSRDTRCRLVFVGENDTHAYGKELAAAITRANAQCGNRIKITGFAPPASYRDYLAAADVAVQLRSLSRGETSASILDCLAHGIATAINANGSAAELPEQVLVKLADDFRQSDLSDALWRLWKDQELRTELSHRALAYLQTEHHPARVGRMYYDAIEGFSRNGVDARYRDLMRALAIMPSPAEPHNDDLAAIAASIARNRPGKQARQMLVDISELVQRDAKSGIQRVVRNVLAALLEKTPAGYRVEPVYDAGGQYVYARNFTCRLLGIQDLVLADDPIEAQAGDIFLGLDLAPHHVPNNRQVFADLRNQGVHLYFVAYDLLPILRPDVFVAGAKEGFTRWLDTVTSVADGIVCISRAVADELAEWFEKTRPVRSSPLQLGYFHLGADISVAGPAPRETQESDELAGRPTILMVGTLEPRKGHAQALSAFELLWKRNVNINLVIVGKQGWLVDELVERLRAHPEKGNRLFWFEGASDDKLLQLYSSASALLAASDAEGFGLPLIEAAQHQLPIIARDLPVFREVAQENAYYFNGKTADALASAVEDWLLLHKAGVAPSSSKLRWLTWAESTAQLLDVVEHQRWYKIMANS